MEVADLSHAIRDQDIDGVRRVLDSGQFSLDEYESGRLAPVIECVSSGGRDDEDDAKRSEILRLLVQYGANVNIRTQALREFFSGAETAVMVAAERGLLNCLEVLVESSADLSVTSPRGDTALMLAARHGLVDCVKYLAEQMSPSMLNHRNRRGQTALMLAASDIDRNNILCLHHLILAGADIDMEDRNGKTALTILMEKNKLTNSLERDAHTPLNLAIWIKSVAIVKLLLQNNVDINTETTTGHTPLMLALRYEFTEAVPLLLDRGAEVNVRTETGDTPLTLALSNKFTDAVPLLLDRGAKVNVRTETEDTPLTLALSNKFTDAVPLLLDRGAKVNVRTETEDTPLTLALSNKFTDAVPLLLDRGAKVNVRTETEDTPLTLALSNKFTDAVPLLLDRGAEVNVRTDTGDTPLTLALSNKFTEAVPLLLDRGAEVNVRTETKDTPLTLALSNKFTDAVPLLLDRGAEVNVRTETKDTPLTLAVRHNYTETVSLLLARGADVNEKFFYPTPLMMAAAHNSPEVASLLIQNGALVNGVDYDKAPLMMAAAHNSPEVASLLIQNGALVNGVNRAGCTPLMKAVRFNSPEVASLLIQNGALVNGVDYDKAPLMIAAQSDSPEVASLLIQNGALVNGADDEGDTPLMIAAQSDSPEVASLLIQNGADVSVSNQVSQTPYSTVTKFFRYKTIAAQMIEKGADIHSVTFDGICPFITVLGRTSAAALTLLVQVLRSKFRSVTALTPFFTNEIDRGVCLALQNGAKINAVATCGRTLLSRCIDGRMKSATEGNTILKLLRLGLDPTLSRRDRYCLHMMVYQGREDVVRALVVNGFPPLDLECDVYIESPSGEKSQVLIQLFSPLAIAIFSLRSSVAEFLAKNLFFTRNDIVRLGRDPEIRQHLEYELGFDDNSEEYRQARQCMNILNELSENPQSLQNLSLIAVSSALSQDLCRDRGKWICRPTFREKVGRLEIPSVFKRALLHQPPSHSVRSHPWSDLPVEEKLCFPPQNCKDCRVVDGSKRR